MELGSSRRKQIGFGQMLGPCGVHPGSFWKHLFEIFDRERHHFQTVFQHILEGLRNKFEIRKLRKHHFGGEASMCLKHWKYCTDCVFSCVLPDALPRLAPNVNFGGLGRIHIHVGTLWIPFGSLLAIFVRNVCAVEYMLGFWCRVGSQGEPDFMAGPCPRPYI